MPVNKRSKFRGSRTCGGGTHKNRRGAGNRGGRGRAGHRDHRFTHYLLKGEVNNGKHGFNPLPGPRPRVLGIGEIDEMIDSLLASGIANLDGDMVVINVADMGIDKVLGNGKVTRKLRVSAAAFSEGAKAKIEAFGGQVQAV